MAYRGSNGRPAGLSDDDSDDGFEISMSAYTPKVVKEIVETIGDKFFAAILSNRIDDVKSLLDEGVDVDMRKASGQWTALMHACNLCHNEIVEMLLSRGADPSAHYQMMTPLMCLFDSSLQDEDKLLDCFNILINHGADINTKDWYNSTLLMHAARHNHPKLACKLLEIGFNLEDEDSDGWTAIFYAVGAGNLNMIQLLKDAGADLSHKDRRWRTLSEIANSKDVLEIVSTYKIKIEENIPEICKTESNFQLMMKECPDHTKCRFYGFSSNALKIIKGIGLQSLVNTFVEHDVQLGQLLTWNEAQWKEIGVAMSFDRVKLHTSVRKYHEHRWNKNSLKAPDGDLNLLSLIQQLCNMIRQFHILSLTSYYCLNNADRSGKREVKLLNKKALATIKVIKTHLKFIKNYAREMDREDHVAPADLITPNMKKKSILKTYIIPGAFFILIISQTPKIKLLFK